MVAASQEPQYIEWIRAPRANSVTMARNAMMYLRVNAIISVTHRCQAEENGACLATPYNKGPFAENDCIPRRERRSLTSGQGELLAWHPVTVLL